MSEDRRESSGVDRAERSVGIVGIFGALRTSVRRSGLHSSGRLELTQEQRAALPPRFTAAGEALAAGDDRLLETCWVVGRDLADVGTSLGESIEGLRLTTRLVRDRDPSFEELRALSVAWSEATLAYLHGLSCADPLTGLASMAHLRERLAELYRDAQLDARAHALVVAEVRRDAELDQLATARRLTLVGHAARTVFQGPEAIGKVGTARVVVVAERDDVLGQRVSLLRRMTEDRADRVWIEGLPDSDASAVHLLDELARGA
jgi:hypothetical protein